MLRSNILLAAAFLATRGTQDVAAQDDQQVCQTEQQACTADADCLAIIQAGGGSPDATQCNANTVCSTWWTCVVSSQQSGDQPCQTEMTACSTDTDCLAIIQVDPMVPADCNANTLCGAWYSCQISAQASASGDPCATDLAACASNTDCTALLPDNGAPDETACSADTLCVALWACQAGSPPSGGGTGGGTSPAPAAPSGTLPLTTTMSLLAIAFAGQHL